MRPSPPKPIERYGTRWTGTLRAIDIEIECIRKGGNWTSLGGKPAGLGLAAHYRNLDRILWPNDVWDEWDELMNKELCLGGVLGIAGPSSSGKSRGLAKFALKLYLCFPKETTVLISSTTLDSLERRIWGEVKKCLKQAKLVYPEFPGFLTESKMEITTDGREIEDGRDRRNGLKAVAVKKGNQWVGLGDIIGTKNKRFALLAEEAPFMVPAFFDGMGNLRSNPWWLQAASGNPKDPMDAFGKMCEPADGWDQLVQTNTQIWRTRDPRGRVIRLDGMDCPNLRNGPGKEPCKEKLTWNYVNDIKSTYKEGSWQWEMWVRARFPVNVMAKRLFIRKFCEKYKAFHEVEWAEGRVTKILAMDAAFGAIGGDRCIAMEFRFGQTMDSASNGDGITIGLDSNGQIRLGGSTKLRLALVKTIIVPVNASLPVLPVFQIANWAKHYCEEQDIPPSHFFFDASMRGEFVSAIMQTWSTSVVAIDFGGPCTDRPDPDNPKRACKDSYWKFVTELAFSLRAVIAADQFRGMTLDIVREAEMRAWDQVSQSGSTRVQIESKVETKERMGWSPDLLDCAIVGVEGARQLGFKIGKLGEARSRSGGPNALDKAADKWKEANRQAELV